MCIFHKWGKWSELFQSDEGQNQMRVCQKCGKIENRKVRNHIGVSIAILNKLINDTKTDENK